MAENENKPERRSLLGWIFLVVTILALCYWLVRRVIPAIFAATQS
ncbi:MAG: hypothetical protein WD894_07585 [Pirellulales bacterium]